MLNVLGLLSITRTFLKSFNNEWGGSWNNANCCDSVFDSYFDLDFDSSPVQCGFLDGFSDLFWVNTESTTLGCENGGWGNFTTNNFEIN